MSNIFSIEQEFNAEASDHGRRSISPTQHTQPSPATSPPILRDNSNPTVLLTDAAASLAAATITTTDSNLMMEDDRMNLDNNTTTATNNDGKGLISNKAISNVTETQPPPAAGDQNNTITNVSHINPATGNNNSDSAPSFDALTNELHWRRGLLFCRNDAIALIPIAEDINPIFRGLLGHELQSCVPHAIDLIQGILSIADHDWKRSDQIPSTTDLSSLPGMVHLLPLHQELLELHRDRKYTVPVHRSGGGGGGGDDKGGDDDGNGDDDDDDNGYDSDQTDSPPDDVNPPRDEANKWEHALLKKKSQRKASKQWDIIRIVFDGLLHCYEQKCRYLREHHLDTRNKARRISQAISEHKKGNITDEEVSCYMVPLFASM
jgi:hypothetical protein